MKKVSSVSDMDDHSVFQASLNSFTNSQEQLNERLVRAKRRLNAEFDNLDQIVNDHRKLQKELRELTGMLNQIRRQAPDTPDEQEKLRQAQVQLELSVREMEKFKSVREVTGSHFVRFMMGRVNVRMWKDRDIRQLKDEYNKFKFRTTFIFLLFPLLQLLVWPGSDLLWRLHQFWLLYFYISLALRENILRVNGSNIHPWWIWHHYISTVVGGVSIMYPDWWWDFYIRDRFQMYMLFAVFQGVIMLLQHQYQRRRAYVRKALGLNKDIDVDNSETLVEKPTDLKILVPLLYVVYVWEAYIGFDLLWLWWGRTKSATDLGLPSLVIALCFLLLAVGNFSTTIYVLVSKGQRRKIRSVLEQAGVPAVSMAPGAPAKLSEEPGRFRRPYVRPAAAVAASASSGGSGADSPTHAPPPPPSGFSSPQ